MELLMKIAKEIAKHGGKMYFVGGFVRDRMIGKDSKDIDVEIHGITEEKLVEILSLFGHVDKIGASFGVYLIKGVDIDFALPRTETKTGELHTDFDVTVDPFIGTYGASRRRDFTMNAIMEDVLTGEIIDHFNGLVDIQNRTIRMVDEETFKEDALRVLRAIQFSARFGFLIEFFTYEVARKMELNHLAKERVYEEIRKGMTKGNPILFVQTLQQFVNVTNLLPSLWEVKPYSLTPNCSLPFNVAMMSLDVPEERIQKVLSDFIQQKQERKHARACRSFFFDLVYGEKTELGMAQIISRHKAFMDLYPQETKMIAESSMGRTWLKRFNEVNQKRLGSLLQIDGKWLIDRGLKPSNTFADSLRQAEVMAWTGSSESEIVTAVFGEKQATK